MLFLVFSLLGLFRLVVEAEGFLPGLDFLVLFRTKPLHHLVQIERHALVRQQEVPDATAGQRRRFEPDLLMRSVGEHHLAAGSDDGIAANELIAKPGDVHRVAILSRRLLLASDRSQP